MCPLVFSGKTRGDRKYEGGMQVNWWVGYNGAEIIMTDWEDTPEVGTKDTTGLRRETQAEPSQKKRKV